jgi:uncharacterized protein YjbJ (UPF0337 family)
MPLIDGGDRRIISPPVQGFLEHDGAPVTEDRHSTSAEHLKGSVKEALGKLTGDARIEAEGRREKREASSQKVGRSKPPGPGRG